MKESFFESIFQRGEECANELFDNDLISGWCLLGKSTNEFRLINCIFQCLPSSNHEIFITILLLKGFHNDNSALQLRHRHPQSFGALNGFTKQVSDFHGTSIGHIEHGRSFVGPHAITQVHHLLFFRFTQRFPCF